MKKLCAMVVTLGLLALCAAPALAVEFPFNETIGTNGLPGSSYTYAAGPPETHTLVGSGDDIWNAADSFEYAYQQVSVLDDVEIIAHAASLTGSADGWAKVGVMIRNDNTVGSVHAGIVASSSNGPSFQRRLTTDGGSSSNDSGGGAFQPTWLRAVKSGNDVTAYYKYNAGDAWTQLGGIVTVPYTGPAIDVGLDVTSHNTGIQTTGVFDNVAVTVNKAYVWDQVGDNEFGTQHWLYAGAPTTDIPGATNAVFIDSTMVSVTAQDRSVGRLTINNTDGKGISIGAGRTLTVANALNVAPTASVTMGLGATLSAGSGLIGGPLNTGGNATVSNGGNLTTVLTVANLNDGGVAGTFTKQGGGLLVVTAGTTSSTTFKTQGGLLSVPVSGINPAKTLLLDGGGLGIRAAATGAGGTADQLTENWYNGQNAANLIDPISTGTGILTQTPGLVMTLNSPLNYVNDAFSTRTSDYLPLILTNVPPAGCPVNFTAAWTGTVHVPTTGVYTLGTNSDDGSTWWVDLDGDGKFSHNGAGGDEMIVNNNYYQGPTTRTGNVALAAGVYKMAIGFYQGGGTGDTGNGATMIAAFAPGANATLDFATGAADIVDPSTQPGLFSDGSPTPGVVNLPTTPVLVTNNSTLSVASAALTHLGVVTLQKGILTTNSGSGLAFASTTVSAAAGSTVGLYTNTPTATGTVTGPAGTAFTFATGGSETFVVDPAVRTVTGFGSAT